MLPSGTDARSIAKWPFVDKMLKFFPLSDEIFLKSAAPPHAVIREEAALNGSHYFENHYRLKYICTFNEKQT